MEPATEATMAEHEPSEDIHKTMLETGPSTALRNTLESIAVSAELPAVESGPSTADRPLSPPENGESENTLPESSKSGIPLLGAIFTGMFRGYGVRGLQAEDLYTLDREHLKRLGTVYGVIFLYRVPSEPTDYYLGTMDPPPGLFFANQVQNNACGTYAIMNIVMNLHNRPGVDLGGLLESYREFTKDMTPALKGETLTNSPTLREVHNSFARQSELLQLRRTAFEAHPLYAPMFETVDETKNKKKSKKRKSEDEDEDEDMEFKEEDVFHYIVYIEVNGTVWELDGLRRGPVMVGVMPHADADGNEKILSQSTLQSDGSGGSGPGAGDLGWLELVIPRVDKKMRSFEGAIDSSLLAILPEKMPRLLLRLRRRLLARAELRCKLGLSEDAQDEEGEGMQVDAVDGTEDNEGDLIGDLDGNSAIQKRL
ncbi:hypothetical protein HDU93_004942, partial [Gonapodya sp. JEL0774]